MPTRPKLSPVAVHAALTEALRKIDITELGAEDYLDCLLRAKQGLFSGGICYDLLILCAAEKSGADKLVTANARDFLRLHPRDPDFIQAL
jgi:hypothetical protein